MSVLQTVVCLWTSSTTHMHKRLHSLVMSSQGGGGASSPGGCGRLFKKKDLAPEARSLYYTVLTWGKHWHIITIHHH